MVGLKTNGTYVVSVCGTKWQHFAIVRICGAHWGPIGSSAKYASQSQTKVTKKKEKKKKKRQENKGKDSGWGPISIDLH